MDETDALGGGLGVGLDLTDGEGFEVVLDELGEELNFLTAQLLLD